MKASITLLALVAAPALALVEFTKDNIFAAGGASDFKEIVSRESSNSGSPAARAAAASAWLAARAADAEFFCQLPTADVSGAPRNAANIDGVCITAAECFSNSGARAFTGVCPGNTDCCIKNDCAGPNSNSACLIPSLPNDPLPPGASGRFVNGECPEDLRCFQVTL